MAKRKDRYKRYTEANYGDEARPRKSLTKHQANEAETELLMQRVNRKELVFVGSRRLVRSMIKHASKCKNKHMSNIWRKFQETRRGAKNVEKRSS